MESFTILNKAFLAVSHGQAEVSAPFHVLSYETSQSDGVLRLKCKNALTVRIKTFNRTIVRSVVAWEILIVIPECPFPG